MSSSLPVPVGDGESLDRLRDGLLAAAAATVEVAGVVEAARLRVAVAWIDADATDTNTDAGDVTGGVRAGGVGCAVLDPAAVVEWAVAVGGSFTAGLVELVEAGELSVRLPRVWARVLAGEVRGWRARRIASLTVGLPGEAAAFVDAAVVGVAASCGRVVLDRLVAAALARYAPGVARDRERARAERRGVALDFTGEDPSGPTVGLSGRLDLVDGVDVDAALTRLAALAAAHGSTLTESARRAAALGDLARYALGRPLPWPCDTTTRASEGEAIDGHGGHGGSAVRGPGASDAAGAAGHPTAATTAATQAGQALVGVEGVEGVGGVGGSPSGASVPAAFTRPTLTPTPTPTPTPVGPDCLGVGPVLRLCVHMSLDDLTPGAVGVARVDSPRGVRVLTGQAVRDWLTRTGAGAPARVTVTPVIDLTTAIRVDQYDIPDRIGRLVRARDGRCVFPHCTRPARAHPDDGRAPDIDHIIAYHRDRGPGQTATDNLAVLCRTHHRAKTFTGWTYRMLHPGTYAWFGPRGGHWLVDPAGTHQLTPPPPAPAPARPPRPRETRRQGRGPSPGWPEQPGGTARQEPEP